MLLFLLFWRWKFQIRRDVKNKQAEGRQLEESLDALDDVLERMKSEHVQRIDAESAKFHQNMDKLHEDTKKLIQSYTEQMKNQHDRRVEYHEKIDTLKRDIMYLNGVLTSLTYANETKQLELAHEEQQKRIDDETREHEHELLRTGRRQDVKHAHVRQALIERVADKLAKQNEKVDEAIKQQFK